MSSGQFPDITIFYMGIKHVTFSWHSESSRKALVSRQKESFVNEKNTQKSALNKFEKDAKSKLKHVTET